jgi:hypothetical protein
VTVPPATESHTPPFRKRRILRALAVLGAALCLLVVLLLLVLQSDSVQKFALDRITAVLASRHIDLQAGSLRYNLFALSIDVRNLRLRSAATRTCRRSQGSGAPGST